MSPWGKFYLEMMDFRPEAWAPFESWRMHTIMGQIVERWGWKVSKHLDLLYSELYKAEDLIIGYNNDKQYYWLRK